MIIKDREDLILFDDVVSFYVDRVQWVSNDPERERLVGWIARARAELDALPEPTDPRKTASRT